MCRVDSSSVYNHSMLREVVFLTIVAACVGPATGQQTPAPPKTEFLMHLRADLGQPQSLGDTPLGVRRIFYVKSGSFAGPRVRGEVLPGGGDWVLGRRDGVSQLDVRITLRSDDGSLIFVNYRGVSDIPPDIRERIAKGEDVPSTDYYFRITPVFETASDKLAWLNRLVAIGIGKRTAKGVAYDIFAVR